ncbi:MAG TPA: tetratricopeptide repeat protein, partial [Chitinophagaceae bacterium]|nr:tetratricopeptide repeat protein [Chitinophagaceae bacterium]
MRINTTFLYFFAFAPVYFSCNDDKGQTPPSSSNVTQGRQMRQEIAKYPDSLLLIKKLIQYYRDGGLYDSALSITDNTIKRAPNADGLWNIKATLHFENGDTINAIRSLEKAIDIFPLQEYMISLGTLYAQTKNPKALLIADGMVQGDKIKSIKEAFFIKGLYYNYIGDKKKAITLFDSCIRRDYTYMFAYREKAIALYDEKKYEEAIIVLTRAVTIQNNFDEGYYWMGNCYKKLNKKE